MMKEIVIRALQTQQRENISPADNLLINCALQQSSVSHKEMFESYSAYLKCLLQKVKHIPDYNRVVRRINMKPHLPIDKNYDIDEADLESLLVYNDALSQSHAALCQYQDKLSTFTDDMIILINLVDEINIKLDFELYEISDVELDEARAHCPVQSQTPKKSWSLRSLFH